jgi:hypothetical protein
MQVWRNCQSFVWTDKWLTCLPECHVCFEVYTQLWTTFFMSRPGWTVAGLARAYCISLICIICSIRVASNGIFTAGTFHWLHLSSHWEDVSWAWSAVGESLPWPTYISCTRAPSPQPLCMKVDSDTQSAPLQCQNVLPQTWWLFSVQCLRLAGTGWADWSLCLQ